MLSYKRSTPGDNTSGFSAAVEYLILMHPTYDSGPTLVEKLHQDHGNGTDPPGAQKAWLLPRFEALGKSGASNDVRALPVLV